MIIASPKTFIKKASFYDLCPEGNYSAVLAKAVPEEKESNESEIVPNLRLSFIVEVPWMRSKPIYAWRNYFPSLDKGSKLRLALLKWLGRDFVQKLDQGDSFDVNTLVGAKAEVTIKHILNDAYANPLVVIEEIRAVGSLTLTTEENKAEVDMGIKRLEPEGLPMNHGFEFMV